MAIAIKKFSFENAQGENIVSATNTPIIKITGDIRRTPSDNPLLNFYIGKRNEYQKNKAFKVEVDSAGNFVKTIELQDGDGLYYITAELLLDNNTYDVLTQQVYFKETKPTIDQFVILNSNSFLKNFNSYDTYFFNSYEISSILVSFASNPVDPDLTYYYKMWLSSEQEPDKSVPISSGENSKDLDISIIENGDYFIYFKVIDSAGNFVTENRKVSIVKITPDVTISYLQIVSNDYFVTNDSDEDTKKFRLLVDIRAGIKIKQAELRLYKNNKMITMKSDSSIFNASILKQLQKSGSYFLDAIDISNWGLTYGEYEIEIYYKDVFNIEYTTNRTSIYVKDRQPKLYCNQLDENNLATLVLDSYTELDFYFEDVFFNFKNKQIVVKKYNPATLSFDHLVGSKNDTWEEIETGVYKTKLKLYLSDKEVNFKDDFFCSENYEFSMSNDYSDSGFYNVPLVYKAEKNKIVLHEEFIFPVNNEFSTNSSGKNTYYVDDNSFTLPNNSDFLYLKLKIKNDVKFINKEFTTTENKIMVTSGLNNLVSSFVNNGAIYLKIDFFNFDFNKEIGLSFSLSCGELTHDSNSSYENEFVCSFYNTKDFVLKNTSFNTSGSFDSFLEEIPSTVSLVHDDLNTKIYNDFYQELTFKSSRSFYPNEIKNNEIKNILIRESNFSFTPYYLDFNICFFKNLETFFSNFTLDELVYTDNFSFSKRIELPRLKEELLFYFDDQRSFNLNNISSSLNEFKELEVSDNVSFSTSFILNFENTSEKNIICGNYSIVSIVVSEETITFSFSGDYSELKYLVFDSNLKNCSQSNFSLDEGLKVGDSFSFPLDANSDFIPTLEYTLKMYNDVPKVEFLFNDIPIKSGLKNGYSSCNIFYKYRDLDEIFMFSVFYDVFTYKPSINFVFDEVELYKYKNNKVFIYSDTLRPMTYKSLEIFCNQKKMVSLTPDFLLDKNVLEIPINVYSANGGYLPNTMYSETPGIFSLYGNAVFVDQKTGKEFSFTSPFYTIEIKEVSNFFNFIVNKKKFINSNDFLNSEIQFGIFEKYKTCDFSISSSIKRTKKMVSGAVLDLDSPDIALNGNSYYNIQSSKVFQFNDFFNTVFESGIYECSFVVTDSLTSLKNTVNQIIEINSLDYEIKIVKQEIIGEVLNFELLFKNDFLSFANSSLTVSFFEFGTDNLINKSFLLKNASFSESIEIPFEKSFVSYSINNFFGKQKNISDSNILSISKTSNDDYLVLKNIYLEKNEIKSFYNENNNLIFEYFGNLNDYFVFFELFYSANHKVDFEVDGVVFDLSFETKNNLSVCNLPNDTKTLIIKDICSDEITTFKTIEFHKNEVFFSSKVPVTLYCIDDSLFKKAIFYRFSHILKIENLVTFLQVKTPIFLNSFIPLVDSISCEDLIKEQKIFILNCCYELLKSFPLSIIKSESHKVELYLTLFEELKKWCLTNNLPILEKYTRERFLIYFSKFSILNNKEILKVINKK